MDLPTRTAIVLNYLHLVPNQRCRIEILGVVPRVGQAAVFSVFDGRNVGHRFDLLRLLNIDNRDPLRARLIDRASLYRMPCRRQPVLHERGVAVGKRIAGEVGVVGRALHMECFALHFRLFRELLNGLGQRRLEDENLIIHFVNLVMVAMANDRVSVVVWVLVWVGV